MSRCSITVRYFAALLLLFSQFNGMAHAAEHSSHDHEHDGVPCLYVVSSDDETDYAIPARVPSTRLLPAPADRVVYDQVISSSSDLYGPPSTGPPVSH